jgi:hypothetical protein
MFSSLVLESGRRATTSRPLRALGHQVVLHLLEQVPDDAPYKSQCSRPPLVTTGPTWMLRPSQVEPVEE